MLSNLVGQYVVERLEYHKICVVYQNQAEVFVLAKDLQNRLVLYNVEHIQVVRETPHQKACGEAHEDWYDGDESEKHELWEQYEECVRKAEETTSE